MLTRATRKRSPAPQARIIPLACLAAVLAFTANPPEVFSGEEKSAKEARIELIRGFISEIAVTKVALPRGKHGVFVDEQGKLDQSEAAKELRENGPAIRPGMPVVITKMNFRDHRIEFEINGGGKKGRKWYQRIEIGVGSQTRPIVPEAPVLTYGSSISVRFKGRMPDFTVQQTKDLLAGVLDFSRHSPTVLYSPTVSPEIKEAIKNHQVIAGMDRDAVLSSKGPPDRKVREVRNDVEQEDWIYGLPPRVLFVTFDGDQVVKVKQY